MTKYVFFKSKLKDLCEMLGLFLKYSLYNDVSVGEIVSLVTSDMNLFENLSFSSCTIWNTGKIGL